MGEKKQKIGGWKWKNEFEVIETPIYFDDYKTSEFKVKRTFRKKIII